MNYPFNHWRIIDTHPESTGATLLEGDSDDLNAWLRKGIDPRKELGFQWVAAEHDDKAEA